ncbi:putative LPS assembly protein LptD [Gynurincola endophyticus]|uniref:putative LPS assembly protein LptD n=1 Tax=Gynurincola endophyticus TaxID=2479004 RepID=UPI000F8F7E31|nr:putative LPS assembly protein LptD [Gynurincola endophyticus]
MLSFLILGSLSVLAQSTSNDTIPPVKTDSLQIEKVDTIPLNDSTKLVQKRFSYKISKDSLDAPINYGSKDSLVMNIPDKVIILYSDAKIQYRDMNLTADSMNMNQQTKLITAMYRRDTAGKMIGKPKMTQDGTDMEALEIVYNFETQRGITKNTVTQQGEMFVQGERIKKISMEEYFAYRAQITTCNLDTPHFAFRAHKMKLINKKMAVSGPIHPEFEGVPIPIYLPFGIFPMAQGRRSGLLPPQFTASEQFGLGLEGLGYYKVFNDYLDVTLRSNIYTYGGWMMNLMPTYRVRYRYNGSMNLSMQNSRILSNAGDREFDNTRTFNITWTHAVDSRARPGTNFSANVNAGSTRYNRLITNNAMRNYQNQMNSSITYSKTWDRFNFTASANHNQNNNTQLITMTLPNMALTMSTLYPFQKKEAVGKSGWYEKLGIGYNSTFSNRVSAYEKDFNVKHLLDTMQWGASHNVPIQLALPQLGPLQITPGISYRENWYSQRMFRSWNYGTQTMDTSINKGFYRSSDMAFSVSMSTAMFGKFERFGKNSNIKAIRHVIRPQVSLNYNPALASKDYYTVMIDSGRRAQQTSYYTGGISSVFSGEKFGGMSFGIDNNIEAKFRAKDSTSKDRVVRLIDGFGINGSYNFLLDSFQLSTFNLYVRTNLFEKINITARANLDPYQVDERGFRVNKFAWEGRKFTPGRITDGSLTISSSFRSKAAEGKDADPINENYDNLSPYTPDEEMAQLAYMQQNPAEFADFNIPWSLNFSFTYNFRRVFEEDQGRFYTNNTASLNMNGDFNITPKWKLGMNTFYDVKTSSVQMLTMYLSRELHCWQLSINVTPVGIVRTFNITIHPKSGLLRDLRINRTRYFYGM